MNMAKNYKLKYVQYDNSYKIHKLYDKPKAGGLASYGNCEKSYIKLTMKLYMYHGTFFPFSVTRGGGEEVS